MIFSALVEKERVKLMPRYIDADQLLKELSVCANNYRSINWVMQTIKGLALKSDPDVIKVVRCKNCTFCDDPPHWEGVKFDDNIKFCYKPERPYVVDVNSYCPCGQRREKTDEN